MVTIQEYFKAAQEKSASDVYLSVGSHPWLKIGSRLQSLTAYPVVGKAQMQALVQEVFSANQLQKFEVRPDLTGTYTIKGQGRLRVILAQGRNGLTMACRLIPPAVPAFETLGLPDALKRLVNAKRGLVLVIGPAGSGKTTTLAALIDYINTHFRKSIVTIEQPPEFVHKNKLSFIEQIDCDEGRLRPEELEHSSILKATDVIMVDGLKNSDSISLGLCAAARGTLALVAVESNGGAAEMLKRILDGFPATERENQRRLLARMLRGAVWQHLLPLKDSAGYRPAVEVLVNDPVISSLISRSGALHLVRPTMAAGRAKGMQTMHQALETLKQESVVDEDVIATFENTMLANYVYPATRAF